MTRPSSTFRASLASCALLLSAALGVPASAQDPLGRLAPFQERAPLPGQDIAILVPGRVAKPRDLKPLAKELAARGYHVFRFRYDAGQRIGESARQLGLTLRHLREAYPVGHMIVAGHGEGGLVARIALVWDNKATWDLPSDEGPMSITLLTFAAPFAGLSPSHLGLMSVFAKGRLAAPVYRDLSPTSEVITSPWNKLSYDVSRHIMVVTDEDAAARRAAEVAGVSAEDFGEEQPDFPDDVRFGWENQYHPNVTQSQHYRSLKVERGHLEVLGVGGALPPEVVALMDEEASSINARAPRSRAAADFVKRLAVAAGVPSAQALAGLRPLRSSGFGGSARLGADLRVARLELSSDSSSYLSRLALYRLTAGPSVVVEVRGKTAVSLQGSALKDRDLVRRLLTAAWDSEGESTARRLLLVGAGTELAAWQLESEWAPMRFPTQSLQDSPRYSDFDYSGGLFDNDIRLRSFRRVSPSVVQMHDRRYGLTFQTTYREGARLYTVKGKGSAELDTRAVLAALLSEDSSGSRRFVPPRASLGEE